MRLRRLLCGGLWLALASGCTDGQLGATGQLRFGLSAQYAETTGFAAPIARGQRMPLAVQGTARPALLNDYPYLEATLTATASDGTAVDVARKDTGRFEAVFPSPGHYTLQASSGGVSDSLTVTVADQAQLRLAHKAAVVLTTDGSKSCSADVPEGAALPALAPNQSLLTSVVPADAAGAPLLGLLELDFEGAGVTASATAGTTANGYSFHAAATDSSAATVTVRDRLTQQVLTVSFAVVSALATCPADSR